MTGKGSKFLLKTDDNKVYLAEVDKQKNGDSKSKKELNHDEKETSSHNYKAEGANGDYTDSYEAADKQGNKSEMIKNESEDGFCFKWMISIFSRQKDAIIKQPNCNPIIIQSADKKYV